MKGFSAWGVIVAGGNSRRMGFDKLAANVFGRPLVHWTIEAFEQCPHIARMVIVCAPGRRAEFSELAAPFPKTVAVVEGGVERGDSVLNGLRACDAEDNPVIAVHDAARPLVQPKLISQVVEAAATHGAAVAAAPVTDTIHRAVPASPILEATVPRSDLWAMQTPQAARKNLLEEALENASRLGVSPTDEVSALLSIGCQPAAITHGDWNFKVTWPRDIELATAVLAARS